MAARMQPAAAIAGGVLVVGALAAARRPALGLGGLIALAILAPFLIVPVRVGAQPPVIALLLALVIVASAVAVVRGSRALSRDRILVVQGVYVLLIFLATGIAWPAGGDVEALQTGLKLAMAASVPLLVVMWLPRSAIVRHGQLVIVGAGALQAALAVGLHVAGDAGIRFLAAMSPAGYPAADIQRFLPDEVTPRATGLLVDPNVLGVTLAMVLPFAMVGSTRSARRFALQATAVGLIVAALMLSLSRGAWVGAAAAALVVVTSTRPRLGAGLAVAGVLGRLKAGGYLDDRQCIETLAAVRLRRGDSGRSRLQREMAARGLPGDLVNQVLDEMFPPEEELDHLRRSLERKLEALPEPLDEKRVARLYNYLLARGFPPEAVRREFRKRFHRIVEWGD